MPTTRAVSSPADGSLPDTGRDREEVRVSAGVPPALGQAVSLSLNATPTASRFPLPVLTLTEFSAADFEFNPRTAQAQGADHKHGPGVPPRDADPDPAREPEQVVVHVSPERRRNAARDVPGDPPVRWHEPTNTVRQRYEAAAAAAAERLGQPGAPRPISSEQTARNASRWARRLAFRDFIAQAVGRLTGLAVATRMMVSTWDDESETFDDAAKAHVILGGVAIILTMGLIFGRRAGHLMARAWHSEGEHHGTAHMLGMGPTYAQLTMILIALQFRDITVGTAVTLNIVNRLVSAGVRDIVAQSLGRVCGGLDVVQPDGRDLDPLRSREAFDRDRLASTRNTYMASSLFLLWICRWGLDLKLASLLTDPGAELPAHTTWDRMRPGLPAIAMSILNEAFDAWQGVHWQDHYAQENELALRFTPGCCDTQTECGSDPKPLTELAQRSIAHAGMRQVFGTLTSDIWTTAAEFYPATSLAVQGFRAAGAAFNSLTTYRGYTVERGLALPPSVLEQRLRSKRTEMGGRIHALEQASADRIRRVYPELYASMRAEFTNAFRELMFEAGVQPDQEEELERVLRSNAVRRRLDQDAAEAVRAIKLAEFRRLRDRPYRLETTGDNEFDLVENVSSSTGTSPSPDALDRTPPPTLPPSAVPSAEASPEDHVRSIRVDGSPNRRGPTRQLFTAGAGSFTLETMAGTTAAGFLEALEPGTAIMVGDEAVTFEGWRNDREERKGPPRRIMEVRSAEPVEQAGWQDIEHPGQGFRYLIEPSRFRIGPRTAVPPADDGLGLGPRIQPQPRPAAGPPPSR